MAETPATNPANMHCMHTHTCGELRAANIGEEVTLTGWVSRRRDHGGLIFCDLRDREGITQINFDPEHSDGDAFKIAETMRPEWPIRVHGVVRDRGHDAVNPRLVTGEIEVLVDHATVLNRSKTPPFQIEDGIETAEDTRLRYRYLDLRRPEMAARLRLRSDFTFAIRSALHDRAFTGGRDAGPVQVHARRCARLRGAEPPAARQLLRPAAVPAAA
ncbi:MAG: OB-fold nucleic acid binding domain-containing protein [Collinsella sp.]